MMHTIYYYSTAAGLLVELLKNKYSLHSFTILILIQPNREGVRIRKIENGKSKQDLLRNKKRRPRILFGKLV